VKTAFDAMWQDISGKKVLLKTFDILFAKAIAAKITKELNCQVDIVQSINELKIALENSDYFVGVFEYSAESTVDMGALDYAISRSLPVVVMTESLDDNTREVFLSKNIIDYVVSKSIEEIDYLVRLLGQLGRNSKMEVLVADDFVIDRTALFEILKSQLFIAYEAKDGDEALEILSSNDGIKLLLTNYHMPKMDGLELVSRLRKIKNKNELAIVAISHETDESIISRFLKFGANDFIKKPFSREEFICRINNTVEHIQLIELQKKLTSLDYLTGLSNRQFFMDAGKTLHANAVRGNIELVIAMIDIDNFKLINDRYGHDVGDIVIKDFSISLRECFRTSDVICRFAGEEFCVILVGVDDKYIKSTFDKLLHMTRKRDIYTKENKIVKYTISVGVCTTLFEDFEEMIKRSEVMLFEAKQAGKDRVVTDIFPS